jgi:hypothetical protein
METNTASHHQTVSELPFTRSRHARFWGIAAVACLVATITLFSLRWKHVLFRDTMMPPPPLWLCTLPVAGILLFSYLMWIHLRRPFLVVSRLGIEIHPLRYSETLDHITWVEIQAAHREQSKLVLTLNTEEKSEIHITLAPLTEKARGLLMRALEKIMAFRAQQVASAE